MDCITLHSANNTRRGRLLRKRHHSVLIDLYNQPLCLCLSPHIYYVKITCCFFPVTFLDWTCNSKSAQRRDAVPECIVTGFFYLSQINDDLPQFWQGAHKVLGQNKRLFCRSNNLKSCNTNLIPLYLPRMPIASQPEIGDQETRACEPARVWIESVYEFLGAAVPPLEFLDWKNMGMEDLSQAQQHPNTLVWNIFDVNYP